MHWQDVASSLVTKPTHGHMNPQKSFAYPDGCGRLESIPTTRGRACVLDCFDLFLFCLPCQEASSLHGGLTTIICRIMPSTISVLLSSLDIYWRTRTAFHTSFCSEEIDVAFMKTAIH